METKENKSSRKKIIIALIAIAAFGLGVYFWLSGRNIESTDNAQLDGNILTVRSSVTAYVKKIYFNDNQEVRQGDTLVLMDTVALYARVLQAKAALRSAQTGIKVSGSKANASRENAAASFGVAESNRGAIAAAQSNLNRLKADYERTQKLFDVKGATQQQLEASRSDFQLAQANLSEAVGRQQSSVATAQSQRETAQSERAQIGAASALVEQREAELDMVQEELKHAVIVAPCSGIVTKRGIQTGQYLSTGANICAIIDNSSLWVSANLKETQLKDIKVGQSVEIEVDAFIDLKLTGKVSSLGGATGAKFALLPPDNASGNFVKVIQRVPVRISIDAPRQRGSHLGLYPGLSVKVKIKTD